MSNQEVIDKISELKFFAIKVQDYEMASKLRDIENSFTNSKYTKVHIEPTQENLKIELTKLVEYFNKYNHKSQCLRDLKLILLLVIIENRDRKIDALVEGKEFNEMKPEDHPGEL